jgi:predicted nucleic acid-binding protein
LQKALAFDVTIMTFPDLHERAWHLAAQLDRPTAYDSHYLALAQILGCEFWTADERLYNASRPHFPWVRWLGSFTL